MTDMDTLVERVKDCLNRYVAESLTECAEKYDSMLRERSEEESFRNMTGNLRSSLGTAVYDRGQKFFESQFATVLNGSQGSSKGKALVDSLAGQYTDCVALVIVAAEDYASEVEDRDSRDVIASVTSYAELEVQRYILQGLEKACKEINSWI